MDITAANGRAAIAAGSQSFATASRFLDSAIRDDVARLYAFCRYSDDLIDGQVMGHGQLTDYKVGQGARLDELRAQLDATLAGTPPNDPIWEGLGHVIASHGIDPKHPHQHLDGFAMDVMGRAYRTVDDVLDYSYHVAGVVGVMMARIMGVRDERTLDRASDLGLAFQLTNIARDVVDDARAGRVFVPSELLARHGAPVRAEDLAKPKNWPAAFRAVDDMLAVADDYYASSKVGVRELGFRNAWAILAALSVYRGIGQRLRAMGPEGWRDRVSTSKGQKMMTALGASGPALMRRRARPVDRSGLYARP